MLIKTHPRDCFTFLCICGGFCLLRKRQKEGFFQVSFLKKRNGALHALCLPIRKLFFGKRSRQLDNERWTLYVDTPPRKTMIFLQRGRRKRMNRARENRD